MAHGLRVKPDGTAPTRGREAFVLSVPCMAYCILTVPPYVSSPVFEWRGLVYSRNSYLACAGGTENTAKAARCLARRRARS
jgi:hypothetical protein